MCAAGFAVPRQRMWAGNGKLLGDVPRARTGHDPMISVTLMRSELVSVLRGEARRAGARIVTGQRLAPDDLAATAADGTDLVVGADGIWPAPDGSVWWSAQVSAPEPPGPGAGGLDELTKLYAAEDRAVSILRATDTGHGVTNHHVLAPVPRWHDDRTVLVGDAAHPVGSGQGASMAIEDAIVLAQQLQGASSISASSISASSIRAALAGYDEQRRARVAKMTKTAASNRGAKVAGPMAARMRDLMMPLFFGRCYEKATAWLYEYDPGTLTATGSEAGVAHK